jgi:hypothetical protein
VGVHAAGFALRASHDRKDSGGTPACTSGEALALDALSKTTTQLVAEQTRGRRWSAFFKSLLALYAGAVLALSVASAWDSLWATQVPHAALVRVSLTRLVRHGRLARVGRVGRGLYALPDRAVSERSALAEVARSACPNTSRLPRYTVVAEKLEALVVLGIANSRVKD